MSENTTPEHGTAASVQDSFELPGAPDQFQRLWTPHRTAYVSGGQKDYTEKTCPFCTAPSRSDEESLIVHRGEHAFVILNLYPYNPRPPTGLPRTATSRSTMMRPRRRPLRLRS